MNKKAFIIGIIASFFFSFTFIFNRLIALAKGDVLWTGSLRYILMFPFILLLCLKQKEIKAAHQELKARPWSWSIWSFVAFGLFYLFLSTASFFGNSWLIVGAWQICIICGILLTPIFGKKIPLKALFYSCLIFIGVIMIVYNAAFTDGWRNTLIAFIFVTLAAICYPLGNRKLMAIPHKLSTSARVYLMCLTTLPFWLLLAFIAYLRSSWPSYEQLLMSFMVAFFSGFLGTVLYFKATDLSKDDPKALAISESTIAGEVIFTLLIGILLINDPNPGISGYLGLAIVVTALCLNR